MEGPNADCDDTVREGGLTAQRSWSSAVLVGAAVLGEGERSWDAVVALGLACFYAFLLAFASATFMSLLLSAGPSHSLRSLAQVLTVFSDGQMQALAVKDVARQVESIFVTLQICLVAIWHLQFNIRRFPFDIWLCYFCYLSLATLAIRPIA